MVVLTPNPTPEQAAARKEQEKAWGSQEMAEDNYGHILKILAGDERRIRDDSDTMQTEDLLALTQRRDAAMARLKELGVSFELDELYKEEESKYKDLRE